MSVRAIKYVFKSEIFITRYDDGRSAGQVVFQ